MSTAATTVAAKSAIKDVAKSIKKLQNQLFHFNFSLNASPINSCTFAQTRAIASDPSHPLYIRTQRRLAAFDSTKLHWTVKAPVDLSRKAVVRNWAVRRVKVAFKEELRKNGWARDGGVIEEGGTVGKDGGGKEMTVGLKGALCIYLDRNRAIVTAEWEEVRRECGRLLKKVEELQRDKNRDGLLRKKKTGRGHGVRNWRNTVPDDGSLRSTWQKNARTADVVGAG